MYKVDTNGQALNIILTDSFFVILFLIFWGLSADNRQPFSQFHHVHSHGINNEN